MNSHIHFASTLEAHRHSSSPETVAPTPMPTLASAITCDPANGVHVPGCSCPEKRVRLNRGH